MIFTISDSIYKFASRDIILVSLKNEVLQPMYCSSGRNSGMPGIWLPFDGINYNGSWFDKTQYCTPIAEPEFHRFGNQELKDLILDDVPHLYQKRLLDVIFKEYIPTPQ